VQGFGVIGIIILGVVINMNPVENLQLGIGQMLVSNGGHHIIHLLTQKQIGYCVVVFIINIVVPGSENAHKPKHRHDQDAQSHYTAGNSQKDAANLRLFDFRFFLAVGAVIAALGLFLAAADADRAAPRQLPAAIITLHKFLFPSPCEIILLSVYHGADAKARKT